MSSTTLAVWRQAVYTALCLALYVAGSDVVFTSSPPTIRQLMTEELTLRCSVHDSAASVVIGKRHLLSDVASDTAPSDVSFVTSIAITKAGADVAVISEHLSAKVFDNSTGVQVTGQIPGAGAEKGFIQVTWRYPGSGQTGSYKCDVRGIDHSGLNQDLSQTLAVSESEVSLSDLVGYVHQLKLNNDANVTDLKVEVSDLKTSNADLKVEVSDLKTSNADLKTTNADLKVQINDLNISDVDLKNKLDTHVMFTAIRVPSVHLDYTNVLVFDTVKTSIGSGYDNHTGVFTCPVAGYYMFDLHIQGQTDKNAQVCISHNDVCVTGARAWPGLDLQSASTSASLLLQRGDTVKAVAEGTSYVEGYSHGYTSFSGQLVAVE